MSLILFGVWPWVKCWFKDRHYFMRYQSALRVKSSAKFCHKAGWPRPLNTYQLTHIVSELLSIYLFEFNESDFFVFFFVVVLVFFGFLSPTVNINFLFSWAFSVYVHLHSAFEFDLWWLKVFKNWPNQHEPSMIIIFSGSRWSRWPVKCRK